MESEPRKWGALSKCFLHWVWEFSSLYSSPATELKYQNTATSPDRPSTRWPSVSFHTTGVVCKFTPRDFVKTQIAGRYTPGIPVQYFWSGTWAFFISNEFSSDVDVDGLLDGKPPLRTTLLQFIFTHHDCCVSALICWHDNILILGLEPGCLDNL